MTLNITNLEPLNYSIKAYKILCDIGKVYLIDESKLNYLSKNLIIKTDILIVRLKNNINFQFLQPFKNLKYIVSATTGLDHIDLDFCSKKNIKVLSLKGEVDFLDTITSTSELTWGLIISHMRNIPGALNDVKNGNWNRDCFKGKSLKGKTLGIIGLGRIGKHIAKYADAFDMKVLGFDPYINEKSIPSNVKNVKLKDLLKKSDIVTIHIPLNNKTKNLISFDEFNIMKSSAVLINTSRGNIVDQESLIIALEENKIAGYSADVLSNEIQLNGKIKNSKFWKHIQTSKKLQITPHIGGATVESMENCEIFMANKLQKQLMLDKII